MEKKYLPNKIEGERILLQRHKLELAEQMFNYVDKDRERLRLFFPWVDQTKNLEDEKYYIKMTIEDWQDQTLFDYGIFRKSDMTYMGNCGVHTIAWCVDRCELGYWILGEFEGQGFMSEAVQSLEKTLFELGFNRIEIRCEPSNAKSASIPRRLHYQLEGHLKENLRLNGRYVDTMVFAKLKSARF